jgi:hypothetical protein
MDAFEVLGGSLVSGSLVVVPAFVVLAVGDGDPKQSKRLLVSIGTGSGPLIGAQSGF